MESGSYLSCVAQSDDLHGAENFPQGCSFAPDGLCVLTYSVGDSQLRLYNTPVLPGIETTAAIGLPNEQSEVALEVSTRVIPNWRTVLSANGGDTVRCYTWYPLMQSSDSASCCFAAASRDQPVQLYDAYSGAVRATYRPYNALDEMESPTVVEFSNDGQKILCGGFRTDRTIHLFDTAVPGRDSTLLRLGKTRRSSDGQKGLVSAACFGGQDGGPGKHVFVVGTYSPGSIYTYDFRAGQQATGTILSGLCVVGHGKGHSRKKRRFDGIAHGTDTNTDHADGDEVDVNWFSSAKVKWFMSRTQGGVTQLRFGKKNDYTLYSASRRSNAVIAWDLRMLSDNPDHQSNPVRGIASYKTLSDTNQRLEFDIDETGQTLFTGCQDHCVRAYNLESGKLLFKIDELGDVANGVSYACLNGRSLLATATGSRTFASEEEPECNDDMASLVPSHSHSVRLYDLGLESHRT